MIPKTAFRILALSLVLMLVFGCAKNETETEGEMADTMETMEADAVKSAVAEMEPTEGNEATGTVEFTMTNEGMQVVAHFEGVPPGEHGFHIHEYGDCSAPDATSAGGHFNPQDMPHAGPDAQMRHVGDLGNITADENGVAHKEFVDAMLTFEGQNSILGKGVILHAEPDDLTSQPTGAAGARISCGVIQAASE